MKRGLERDGWRLQRCFLFFFFLHRWRIWKLEREVVRNKGLKLLSNKKGLLQKLSKKLYQICLKLGELVRLSRRERERERELGLSGLQGPKHYWRWQFCPAAGTESCGDSHSLSLNLQSREKERKWRKALQGFPMDCVICWWWVPPHRSPTQTQTQGPKISFSPLTFLLHKKWPVK